MGAGAEHPEPTACIVVGGEVVGWVDAEVGHDWLGPGEVNVGYNVFARHRGRGHATRAVRLLVHHLAVRTSVRRVTLLIDPGNGPSLAVAGRAGFEPAGEVNGQRFLRRPVPPTTYTDGVVAIRRLSGQGDTFGTGPRWTFGIDAAGVRAVGHVDCDLANPHVLAGEANVSYSCQPAHRSRGYATRALRLLLRFLGDHTAAREAHVIVDRRNAPSLRVAHAVGAAEAERWTDDGGNTMVRHIVEVRRP